MGSYKWGQMKVDNGFISRVKDSSLHHHSTTETGLVVMMTKEMNGFSHEWGSSNN
jgi:hypothetical protein